MNLPVCDGRNFCCKIFWTKNWAKFIEFLKYKLCIAWDIFICYEVFQFWSQYDAEIYASEFIYVHNSINATCLSSFHIVATVFLYFIY